MYRWGFRSSTSFPSGQSSHYDPSILKQAWAIVPSTTWHRSATQTERHVPPKPHPSSPKKLPNLVLPDEQAQAPRHAHGSFRSPRYQSASVSWITSPQSARGYTCRPAYKSVATICIFKHRDRDNSIIARLASTEAALVIISPISTLTDHLNHQWK